MGLADTQNPAERVSSMALRLVPLVAVVPYGSTGPIAMPVAFSFALIWCVGAAVSSGRPWPALSLLALAIAGLTGAWGWVQMSTDLHLMPPAPSYADASRLLGEDLLATPSIGPGLTRDAIVPVLTPLLLFAVALRLLRTDEAALFWLRYLSGFGGAIALFGIVQHLVFPNYLLLEPKIAYRDSLTAVFVNRNSAATFLGGTVLIALSLAAYEIGNRPTLAAIWALVVHRTTSRREKRARLQLVIAFFAAVALAMTASRAGGGATGLAAVTLILGLYRPQPARRPSSRFRWTGLLVRLGSAFAVVLGAAFIFAGRTVDRAIVQGVSDDRFCVYPGMFHAAGAHWPWGSGLGTFELAFRPFRNPACGIHNIWDRAHSFFLEGLITAGALFVVVAICALVALVLSCANGWRRRRRFRPLAVLGLAAIVLFVVHDLVDFSIQVPGISLWAATLLAACCSIASRRNAAFGGGS